MTLAVIALVLSARIDAEIELPPMVGTTPTVVDELAKASGLKLKAGKNVANDVLGLAGAKAPARVIMDHLAYAVQAEWKESGGEWTLFRTEAQIKQQEQTHRNATIEQIKAAIQKLPPDKAWSPEEAKSISLQIDNFNRQNDPNRPMGPEYRVLADKMPGRRLLNRFLRSIAPETLADLPMTGRAVYSTSPNGMQRPMPVDLKAAVSQFVKENNELAEVVASSSTQELRVFERPVNFPSIDEVHVSATRSALNGIRVELHAYSPKGKDATPNVMQTFQLDLDSGIFKPDKVTAEDVTVELSPLSRKVLTSAMQSMQGRPFNPPKDVRDFLKHPKLNEPLALINTECLTALWAAEKKPIVVILPEIQFFVTMALAQDGKVTLKRYQNSLATSGLSREEKDGWITYREADPVIGRIRRVDRQSFDDYFRRIERDGRNSLDGFAEFVIKYPGRLENTMFPIFLMISGSYPTNFQYDDDLSMVRLFGLLTPAQKEALKQGRKFPINDFTAPQQKLLADYIYGKRYRNWGFSSQVPPEDTDNGYPWATIRNEPTELFPNGLADPFELSAQVTDTPSWFVKRSYGESQPIDPNGIAWQRFQPERPDLFPYVTQIDGDSGGYARGQNRQWMFRIKVGANVSTESSLSDHTFPEGEFTPFANLPKELRDDVAKRIAELREQYKNTKPSEFGVGRGSPPPLP